MKETGTLYMQANLWLDHSNASLYTVKSQLEALGLYKFMRGFRWALK